MTHWDARALEYPAMIYVVPGHSGLSRGGNRGVMMLWQKFSKQIVRNSRPRKHGHVAQTDPHNANNMICGM